MNISDPAELRTLIDRAKKGDAQAFSSLYTAYVTPLYRYVYFRIGDTEETEDIVQDVFLKAYSSFSTYSYSGRSPLAYFYTIARNTIIDYRRKKKIPIAEEDDELKVVDTEDTPLEETIKKEQAHLLYENISNLPEDQQDALVLKFIQDLSTKEIAELLGKSEEAVRQFQSRALKSLRIIYEQDE